MLNPYFQQGSRSEQNLIQDLINEQLRMYGVEVHYLPRKYLTTNTVIKEVIQLSLMMHTQLRHMWTILMDTMTTQQYYQSLEYNNSKN